MSLEKYLDFLREERVETKQRELLNKKISNISRTRIGKEIGVSESSRVQDLPFTSYKLYSKYFEAPAPGAFMHPLDDYLRVMTTGTMGVPKWYLLPKTGVREGSADTFLAELASCSHDGKNVMLQEGDTVYVNLAPKPFFTGYTMDYIHDAYSSLIRIIPSAQETPFPEKIDLFIRNYEKIAVAIIPLAVLWDIVYPRVKKNTKLKGYVTADLAMGKFREKMLEIFGVVPCTAYGSTETGLAAIPSAQHFSGVIFDWRVGYFELIRETDIIEKEVPSSPPCETTPINEAQPGKRYQLVATPFGNDLVRYVMMDVFECLAKGDDYLRTDLPVFRFIGRVGGVVSLHNFTRIEEDEVVRALKGAGVEYIDFTVRHETEGTREYMAMYLESTDQTSPDKVKDLLHEQLSQMDRSYADIQKFYGHTPLKIILLPRGTFARYQQQRVGIVKPERMGMKEENFKTLMQIAEEVSANP